ncbi:MAG: epimerase [Sandaracinaceae bacterium]|nr:epimerase [Sandaracinaceae bacterium]
MRAILFGATGMIGQGVLQECIESPDVEAILIVGRSPSGAQRAPGASERGAAAKAAGRAGGAEHRAELGAGEHSPKVKELIHQDFFDYTAIEAELDGYDACFFCLGVSSAGMGEEQYRKLTYDLTMRAAETLARIRPAMTFCYVSGAGTDSSEKGRSMWARVKGKTENDLLKLPFARAFMFRPGYVQPGKGVRSKTGLYQFFYTLLGPLYPLWRVLAPGLVTTTANVGRAMIRAARDGYDKRVLEVRDINALAS